VARHVKVKKSGPVMKPRRRRRYRLSELMAQFKPEHRQGEWDLGKPVGKEVW
jgi:antitoxin component of MazEF toxin-antitoxin module